MKSLAEVVADALAEIPSIIGRLRFLGAHRVNGAYCHPAFEAQFGEDVVQAVFAVAHNETYALWTSFDQQMRLRDLILFTRREHLTPTQLVSIWINSGLARQFVPIGVENDNYFLRELATTLLLLSLEPA